MTAPTDETVTPVDEPAKKTMTLPELRKFDGQLFIQNSTQAHITFKERLGDQTVDFELQPAGEPDDTAFLPKLALDMRGLQKLWMKGAVSISTDPEMEDQIMLKNAQAVGASEARMREMLGLQTENQNHRDITELACLVCGRRNPQSGVIELGRVLHSRRQVKEGTPPLCPTHLDQAIHYVPRLVADAKGEEHWEFDTIQMGATQR